MTNEINAKNINIFTFVKEMLETQSALNAKSYNTEWIDKAITGEFDYPLAASMEIAEFINSYGYSWWSSSPRDIPNCKTEIVDAVHFMLSQAIADYGIHEAISHIVRAYEHHAKYSLTNPLDVAKKLITNLCYVSQKEYRSHGSWVNLFNLSASIDFTVEQLHARYIGKSVLNSFRQLNGYKNGTVNFGACLSSKKYMKKWDGVNEDNYFLSKWIDESTTPPSKNEISKWLEEQYEQHCLNSTAKYLASLDSQ